MRSLPYARYSAKYHFAHTISFNFHGNSLQGYPLFTADETAAQSDEHFTEGRTKQTLTCFVIIRSCRTNCLLVSFKKHKVNVQ